MKLTRRQSFIYLSASPFIIHNACTNKKVQETKSQDHNIRRPKLSLNLYSFNDLLRSGKLSLDEVIDFCFKEGYEALDPTAYYFKGYPEVPSNEYLFAFKRKVFDKGLEISGTGIRNDFSVPDKPAREEYVRLIENWALATSKMGIPVMRIFAGHEIKDDQQWEEAYAWMTEDFRRCAAIGESFGVIMALQNHGEYIKNADQVIRIMKDVNSPWFKLHLDIANFGEENVYEAIEKVIGYAVNWQVKEFVTIDGQPSDPDYIAIMKIIKDNGYTGYLPLETLGEGDPFDKLDILKKKVTQAMDLVFG